jgi:type IV pilus assembly protein PilM
VSTRVPLVYKEAAHFGFDIGTRTAKMVQVKGSGHKFGVQGYGHCFFPPETVVEGIIVDPEAMANAIRPVLKKPTFGSINAKRVVTGLPAAKIFTRTLQLPPMDPDDLEQAVRYEVEQYVPVPVNDLSIDYQILNHPHQKKASGASKTEEAQIDVIMVAAPTAIVNSYIKLFEFLELQVEAIEPNLTAVVRAMQNAGQALGTSLIIDMGSSSTDLTIYDGAIPLTGSVPVGGDHYTNALVKALGIKPDQATEIKVKFGIGPSGMRDKVAGALDPQLKDLVKEARRVLKFYQDRSEKQRMIDGIIISGGTASMPGLAEYLQQTLKLPLVVANPWKGLDIKKDKAVGSHDAPMYTTAIGLALRGHDD